MDQKNSNGIELTLNGIGSEKSTRYEGSILRP